jgi:hypothetical protein
MVKERAGAGSPFLGKRKPSMGLSLQIHPVNGRFVGLSGTVLLLDKSNILS